MRILLIVGMVSTVGIFLAVMFISQMMVAF